MMVAALRSYKPWKTTVAIGDEDEWFEGEFAKALLEIDMRSSPGICQFRVLGSTNSEVFLYDKGLLDPERVALVRQAVYNRYKQLINGEAVADPLNVFIKPEPHKERKLQQRRYRLISAVSLVDTMVDRVLFGWLQRKALAVVGSTPCLCGWTPLRGGWRYVAGRFVNETVACLDKSSWDWTVQAYMVDLWLEFIKSLAVAHSAWWSKAAEVRFRMLFEDAVFQFKDGQRVRQMTRGIMKSGCLLTLILNSVGQSFLHYLAMIRLGENPMSKQPICVGDDTVQVSMPNLEEYVRLIEELGAKVKGFKVQNWVEFCGFAITPRTCVPAYWQKHLFKLQYGDLSDSLESYQIIYANEPLMFSLLTRLASIINPQLAVAPVEARLIMNG